MRTNTAVHHAGYVILIFLILLSIPEFVQGGASPAPIGTVKEIRSGTLERQERDLWKPLSAGMAITANDRVRTSANGSAVLTLTDIGAVLVGPNTEYYLGDPARGFKSLLKRGYLWISTKLKPGATMSVATSNAVAGVRGTKFSVLQDARVTEVCTCKGEVQLTLKDGKSANIKSGMFGEVNAAGKMGAPANGKPHLEKIWKERPAKYAACLNCHQKGKKKIGDLN